MNHPTIAIVGAGLSGLVCARILQRHGRTVTVYELDASASARQQGGSLDIHHDTGQVALTEAGLYAEFLANVHQGGEATRVLDKRAHVYVDLKEPKGGNGRPEIDRTVLRQVFVDSLEPGTIQWGRKVVAVRPGELEFADGTVVRADIIVGADGAWSRVRSLLTPVKPTYAGVTIVEIRLSDAPTKHPEALALVGQGSLFAMSDNKYIGGHGGDEIALGIGLRVDESWLVESGIDSADADSARSILLREFADWDAQLTDLIRASDDTVWPRQIFALPVGHRWTHVAGATLIGDAAHLMSPFAGEGANLAMIDGADLARELVSTDDVEVALVAFEQRMFARGAKSAAASAKGLDRIFSADAPRKMVAFFRVIQIANAVLAPLTRLLAR